MVKLEKKMEVGLACTYYYSSELKFITTTLLFIFSLLTILTLLPFSPNLALVSQLRTASSCTPTNIQPKPDTTQPVTTNTLITKRHFHPYGSAAYAFILMSAYRTGPHTFSIIGLSSKPMHIFTRPSYTCRWVPHDGIGPVVTAVGYKTLPDWGYGRVYTTVVVTCTFDIGTAGGKGGKLMLVSNYNGGDKGNDRTDTIEALVEKDEVEEETVVSDSNSTKPKYDYLYCGSSVYGDLSPQRIREWIAYHVRLFGNRSHFVFHDSGGIHEAVMEVLRPWMDLGYVTVHDVREQERFDGYYHNQFLIVNDCLLRYKFDARWIFFFDVDEYLYLPKKKTIKFVTDSLAGYSQFTFEQMPMSNQLCLEEDKIAANKRWGFEKLVYRDVKRVRRRDRKYAVQPQYITATGVHMSQNLVGKTNHKASGLIQYFHYHGTVNMRNEPCRKFTNTTSITVDDTPYVIDTTMRGITPTVRKFELQMIGTKLLRTQQ